MIHDAVDFGNEVRKQYVPKHVRMPEARKGDEILLPVPGGDNLKVAVSPEPPHAIIKPDSMSNGTKAQP